MPEDVAPRKLTFNFFLSALGIVGDSHLCFQLRKHAGSPAVARLQKSPASYWNLINH